MPRHLSITTFGDLSIQIDGEPITGMERRSAALLVYLACTERNHARDVLAEMFWEEDTAAATRNRFRGILANVIKYVDPFVVSDRFTVAFDATRPSWWLDTVEFERCIGCSNQAADELERAAELYQGDFLEGFYIDSHAFDEWALLERERYRMCAILTLDKLVELHIGHEHYIEATHRATQLLQIDPLREASHTWLILLLALTGQRTAALTKAAELRRMFQQELGVELSPQTNALIEAVRAGQVIAGAPARTLVQHIQADERQVGIMARALLIRTPDDLVFRPERLVGRDDLFAQVSARLAQYERVLLQGFSGIGKTALAAEITAATVAAGRGPAVWLQAGRSDGPALLLALARLFGAHQRVAGQDTETQCQAIRQLLRDRAVELVVLDDIWSGLAARQVLNALPPEVHVLATSRQRIPIGRIVTVEALDLPDAVALLSHHAYQSYSVDDAGAVRLCEQLGFHPFALEIAGKTLITDELTPDALSVQIAHTPDRMTMPQLFAEEGRQSVKQLLDASFDALDARERDVFLAFGQTFTPTATPELLALCLEREPSAVTEALIELQRRGLVNRLSQANAAHPVYGIHDLAHSYAQSNTALIPETMFCACRAYAASYQTDLAALDAESDNLILAVDAARAAGFQALFLEIVRLLTVDAQYFKARGYSPPILDLIQQAIDQARNSGEQRTTHYLLGKLGDALAQNFGRLEPAIAAYQEALDLARALHDTSREVTFLTLLGTTRFRQGADDADTYYERAYAIATQHADPEALAYILSHRSFYEGNKTPPDYENSWHYSNEAVRIAEQHALADVWFASLINRASCEREMGHSEAALASDRAAYDLAVQQNNHMWQASAQFSLGKDFHAVEDRDHAQQHLVAALASWRTGKAAARLADLTAFMEAQGYPVPLEGPSST